MPNWLRLAEASGCSGPNPALAGTFTTKCPGPCSGSFWRSPRRKLPSLWAMLYYPDSTEVLPGAQREPPAFQFVLTSSYAGTEHHRKELGSHPLHQITTDIGMGDPPCLQGLGKLNGNDSLVSS